MARVFALVGLGIYAAVALTPVSASAEPTGSIVVKGNKRVEAATIRAYFHAGSRSQSDAATVDQALKEIYASGLFEDVRVDRSGSDLVVTVVEAPVIGKVQIEGNRNVNDKQILPELQSKSAGAFTKAKAQEDVVRITELYHASGRYDVKVEPKKIERGPGRVDLVFEVREGDKTPVRKIVFVGNRSQSERRLRDVIHTRENNLLSFLKGNDVYDADAVNADSDLLRRFYRSNGYADVRIKSAGAVFDPLLKGFIVTFAIDEGERYRFGTVEIAQHVAAIDSSVLKTVAIPSPGDLYNPDLITKAQEKLTLAVSKAGRPFTTVVSRDKRDPQNKTIDVVIALDEGARTYVERIDIHGNLRTQENVVRREFDIGEGDPYNRALLDRAEKRLKSLGFFKTVKITSNPGSTRDRVIVDVQIEEQKTGDFTFGGGYSQVDGFMGNVSIGDQNLLGRGDQGKVSASLGQYSKSLELSFTEPYAFGTRLSAGIDLFGKQSLTNSYQSYGSEMYGARFQLGMPWTDEFSQQVRYSIYNQSISLDPALNDCSPANPAPGCYVNGEASLPVKQAALNGPTWVSMIGSSAVYNTLDRNKNPTDGFRAQVNQDVAGLGGDAQFLSTTADVRYYHEVTEGVTGMVRAQGGYLAPWGSQQVPFQSSFFGGPQFVRGFAANGFGPRDLTSGTTNDNIGGSRYFATTAELQTAMPFAPADLGLRTAIFADAGSLWGYRGPTSLPSLSQSMTVGDSKTIRSSLGAGLLWDSPVGAIRVDYAFPTTKAPYDVTQRLRFSASPF